MEGGAAADSEDLERHLNKQLGAMRQCAHQSSEYRSIPMEASFGPDGRLVFTVDVNSARRSMQECVAKIPSPGYFKGPANRRLKCADYCQ